MPPVLRMPTGTLRATHAIPSISSENAKNANVSPPPPSNTIHYSINMLDLFRTSPALVAALSGRCGVSYMPRIGIPSPAGRRTDIRFAPIMVVKLLDGAPKRLARERLSAAGARNPAATPDRDIAEELRKRRARTFSTRARTEPDPVSAWPACWRRRSDARDTPRARAFLG